MIAMTGTPTRYPLRSRDLPTGATIARPQTAERCIGCIASTTIAGFYVIRLLSGYLGSSRARTSVRWATTLGTPPFLRLQCLLSPHLRRQSRPRSSYPNTRSSRWQGENCVSCPSKSPTDGSRPYLAMVPAGESQAQCSTARAACV